MSHTPGPWKFNGKSSKEGNYWFNVIGTKLGEKFKIARCPYVYDEYLPGYINSMEREEAEANANLIAMSPEMKDLLDKWLEASNHIVMVEGNWQQQLANLKIQTKAILIQLDNQK